MPGGEAREVVQQPFLEHSRLERGEEHHEGVLPHARVDRRDHAVCVELEERRLDGGESMRHLGQQLGRRDTAYVGPHDAVEREDVHAIAGLRGEGAEEEGGVDRGVEPRAVADACGRRTAGVEHDHDAAVALRTPGAHHDVGGSCRGTPVDRSDVVPDHVLTKRVELGALTAHEQGRAAVELA